MDVMEFFLVQVWLFYYLFGGSDRLATRGVVWD
jgi:hypothetical protein